MLQKDEGEAGAYNVHVQGLKRTCKEKKARQGLAKATKSSTYTVGLKESKFPGATRSWQCKTYHGQTWSDLGWLGLTGVTSVGQRLERADRG